MTRRLAIVAVGLSLGCVGQAPPSPTLTATSSAQTSAATATSLPSSGSTSLGSTSPTIAESTSVGDGTTGPNPGTTKGLDDDSSSGLGTSSGGAEPSPIGCADGIREALIDERAHPSIAACAGGFSIPGVNLGAPSCDRQGGNDGPLPDGKGCSIDDLCAAGWHLCTSRIEVAQAGVLDCDDYDWGEQFFATAQSGRGDDSCDANGTNDVFGCGGMGNPSIFGCAPLNRGTGNLCFSLDGSWECDADEQDEASYLTKPDPDSGGALCCRDS